MCRLWAMCCPAASPVLSVETACSAGERCVHYPTQAAVVECKALQAAQPCTLTCTLPCSFLLPQVYVHVDESLHGMDVIKAFDAVNYFIQVRVVQGTRGSGLME